MSTENQQTLQVDFIHSPVINFSLHQNKIPVIRKLVISNISGRDLQDIKLELLFDPEFATPFSTSILSISNGESVPVTSLDIKLSPRYLSQVTERISGLIKFKVYCEGNVAFSNDYKIDILAFDQWQGITILPEMISSLVTPNNPFISGIISKASGILQSWTGNPSFDEYQSRSSDRVKKQMAAVFESLRELNIIYCPPPVSFEESGQRIRLIDTILNQKQATCLDLSLLYISCLEAMGLHPILVFMKGHSFPGCWLIDNYFADSINDDPSLLSKRIADGINEILLVEATQMNSGNSGVFDDAVKSANHQLGKYDQFQLFVDITRSRMSGIRPLPQRVKTEKGWDYSDEEEIGSSHKSPEEIVPEGNLVNVNEREFTKQQIWERRLLDLSLRNNLLNTRINKSTIQLITSDLGKIEDALAAGDEFQLVPKPSDWENPNKIGSVFQAVNQNDSVYELINKDLGQKRLRTYLNDIDLGQGLKNLYRSSKLSIEENGANTLYLCLGLLMWYETPASVLPRFSPLLLLPVEIIRKSALKGYVIRGREEETLMNITLLEMLRQDFGVSISGLDPLPCDDSGVDVKKIFTTIRHAIMVQDRWDILEEALLGIFSFNKFIMWNDIHNNGEKLARNKVVSSLLSGKINFELGLNQALPEKPDDYHPSEIALPINADSSQFEAICAANEGRSFILHGPPGTGKSQTITNIIANSLFNGKRVLFASEKMAALSVVQNRLESLGLGPFCLELHSNKSKKTSLLEQLKRTTEVIRKKSTEDFLAEAERIKLIRNELNGYVEALHKKYSFGFSLYDAFSGYATYKEFPGEIHFDNDVISTLEKEHIGIWIDRAEELKATGLICGKPHDHPLTGINVLQYSQQLKNNSSNLFILYISQLNKFRSILSEIQNLLKIDEGIKHRNQLIFLRDICTILVSRTDIPAGLLMLDNLEESVSRIIVMAETGIRRNKIKASLLERYNAGILNIDAQSLQNRLKRAEENWLLPRLLERCRINKSLKQFAVNVKPGKSELNDTISELTEYQDKKKQIEQNRDFLSHVLGDRWQEGEGDWHEISKICNTLLILNKAITGYSIEEGNSIHLKTLLVTYLNKSDVSFRDSSRIVLQKYLDSLNEIQATEKKLSELLVIDFDQLEPLHVNTVENSLIYCNRWISGIDSLRDWICWNQAKGRALNDRLAQLVQIYEQGIIQGMDVVSLLMKSIYHSCADFIIENDDRLSGFNGKIFNEKINKFRELNHHFEQLTREELLARLLAKVPFFDTDAALSSEIAILKRNISNGGRGVSIRKLFDTIPVLITRLCPCMLMSPISVAQYIDIDNFKFDLIIFDEASQIPTCEAVVAISRGDNLIVAGDPKQMPPTNFFTTNYVDEENIEKEDLESILDDCLALSFPSRYLLWHYRSKHESLITFSNFQFYENKLLTFPSPDDLVTKVKLKYINGFYDRGKSRQNSTEARAIIDEILRRLSDPDLVKKSIGVVTFSSAQQILIDDMLTDAFRQRPDLETKAFDSTEALFIKNLENVQGDERDVILFSVGYGPDKDNKITLNFGPLNREGGWRRLNVAVSRARYEMTVFTTLRADQIDITRTTSQGVVAFRAFLEYAEKGKNALNISSRKAIDGSSKSSIIDQLARKLNEAGFNVVTDIGSSGFKIDIGIINPDVQTEFLLGILFDGYNYKVAKTARDREIIQNEVLNSLGWRIHRIWSCDWWDNQAKVLDDIKKAVQSAQDYERDQTKTKSNKSLESSILNVVSQPESLNAPTYKIPYRKVNLTIRSYQSDPNFLSLNSFRDTVRIDVKSVLEAEAPVSWDLLCRRILSVWTITRMGSKIEAFFNSLFTDMKLKYTISGKRFYWNDNQNDKTYMNYRISQNDSDWRDASDIPSEEISVAVREILENQISMSKEDLTKETARIFGYNRIGTNVESSVTNGINKAFSRGFARIEGSRIYLME